MYGYGHEYRPVYVYKYRSNVSKYRQAYCNLERILIMRRNNLLKAGVLTLVLTLAIGMTACGKKNNTVKDNDTTVTQENVTTADKNNTKKSSKVVFDYTDADGVTTKLEGNATVNDNGEATIEVVDSNGNKTVFTGKANTDDGKLSVSDIKVSEGGTLVKTDGTEVKVSEDAKIEDATESTEATKADVAAKEKPKEDTIVADGSDSNVSEGNENAGDNGTDNGNVSDTPSNVETPDVPNTPSEPEYVPNVPSEPEPTPEEPQPSEPEEPEVITTVNPFDGKTYTYVAPEDMDYKYGLGRGSEVSAINGNPNADWDYSCEFKTLTTRTFYQLDGTYTVYEGWYSMSGDFTATPKQIASSLGIDPYKAFGSCAIVGKFYDERRGDYTEVAFRYLRP